MDELWKTLHIVSGLQPGYEVSNLGRVRKRTRFSKMGERVKILNMPTSPNGYPKVILRTDPEGVYNAFVHVLVGKVFVEGERDGYQINHKDTNRANARADNLEWTTGSDNQQKAAACKPFNKRKPKWADADIIEMRKLAAAGLSYGKIQKIYDIDLPNLSRIINRKRFTHLP